MTMVVGFVGEWVLDSLYAPKGTLSVGIRRARIAESSGALSALHPETLRYRRFPGYSPAHAVPDARSDTKWEFARSAIMVPIAANIRRAMRLTLITRNLRASPLAGTSPDIALTSFLRPASLWMSITAVPQARNDRGQADIVHDVLPS